MEDIAKDDIGPQKTKSPKGGAKGTRKRKSKAVESVEEELVSSNDRDPDSRCIPLTSSLLVVVG